jgi:hypothetical protein
MGSRHDYPSIYWTSMGEEQCVVGCFRGTLNELEEAVRVTHRDNATYLHDYLTFIEAVRTYQRYAAI